MSHTKEPWRIGRFAGPASYEVVRETVGATDIVVDTETGVYVLAQCNNNFPEDAKANARRIVACVNACAGISTENLEDNIPVKELALRYNETIRQRDELLAALNDAVQIAKVAHEYWDRDQDSKVGKYLMALAGNLPGYSALTDGVHKAIASVNGSAA